MNELNKLVQKWRAVGGSLETAADELERSLAAGKVAYTVECVHFTTQEGTCFFEVKTNDPPEDGSVLYAAPRAEQHPDDIAVDQFAEAMKAKLAAARAKGRGGWDGPECNAHRLSRMLRDHVEKGDPRDVANFCMFLHQRGESILPATVIDKLLATAPYRQEADYGRAYSIDADPAGIRARVAHAIIGAMAYGAQDTNPPPSDDHWLAQFWHMARAEHERDTAPSADPAKAIAPEYDRSLIADMLTAYHSGADDLYTIGAIMEQIRLLRAADNADAAKVRTVRFSGSAPSDEACAELRRFVNQQTGVYGTGITTRQARRILEAWPTPPASAPEVTARPIGEYHEDMGPVVWWAADAGGDWMGEPAWIGSPDDSDWPGYHTHFTPHPQFPRAALQQEGKSHDQ